ncbi:MAG: hypothetical protein KAX31_00150, partial [Thermoplasmata archaeon]|nr:hypothetical protein [Thermoplasmata archaeon]
DPPVPAQTFNEDDPTRDIDLSGRGHGSIVHQSGINPLGNALPFYGGSTDQIHVQYIYTPDQVGAEGVIRSIAFNRTDYTSTGTFNNFIISMAHTSLDALTTTFAGNFDGYLIEVFPNQTIVVDSSDSNSWVKFDLNDNFTYDSSHNLLVDITWSGDSGTNIFMQRDPIAGRRIYNVTGTATATGTVDSSLPVLKFTTDVVDNAVVDNGNGPDSYPFNGSATYAKMQMLYNASELGGDGGITDVISFYKDSPGVSTFPNLTINVAHTTVDNLTKNFTDNYVGSMTNVYFNSSFDFPDWSGWIDFDINNTFNYNGVDNLLVEIVWNGTATFPGAELATFDGFAIPNFGNRRLWNFTSGATSGSVDTNRYNIRTIFLESANLSWSASSSDTNLFTVGVSGRTLQITPVADAFGDGTVTLTLHNSNGETVSQHIPVTINPVNDAPVLSGVPASIHCTEDVDFVLNMTSYASDIDNNAINLTFSTDSVYAFTAGEPEITFNYPEGILNDFVNITVRDPGGLTDT